LVREALAARGPTSTGDLKEILGVNRRSAVLFLELLDREKVTRRVGDNRELVG
jgi:selenocysteine-specific elongation factor